MKKTDRIEVAYEKRQDVIGNIIVKLLKLESLNCSYEKKREGERNYYTHDECKAEALVFYELAYSYRVLKGNPPQSLPFFVLEPSL